MIDKSNLIRISYECAAFTESQCLFFQPRNDYKNHCKFKSISFSDNRCYCKEARKMELEKEIKGIANE